MLLILGTAVATMVFEAVAILVSTELCARHPKLKRRGGKRYRGDAGYGNGYARGGNRVSTTGVIFASSVGDGDGGVCRGDGGGRDDAGTDHGGGTDGGDGDGGDDGGGGGGGCGGGCRGGGGD